MNKSVSFYTFCLSLLYLLFIKNLILVWIMMELNMFCFIMYLVNVSSSVELIMFVFLIQIFSSFLMVMFIFLNFDLKDMFFFCGLNIKLAFFPVLYWYFILYYILSSGVFLLLTIQKIFVFYLISTFMMEKLMILYLLLTLLVVLINMSQNKMKIIIILSSLFHSVWILSSYFLSLFLFLFYLSIYTLTLWFSIDYFTTKNDQMINMSTKFIISIILLTISSIPPFILFVPKLYLLYFMQIFLIFMFIFLIFTLLNMTLYLRMLFFLFISAMKLKKTEYAYNLKIFFIIFLNFVFLLLI